MITGTIPTTSTEWVEVLAGSARIAIDGAGARGFYLTFSTSDTPPNGGRGRHFFGSWSHGFDFEGSGYGEGQRIWAMSKAPTDDLIITRDNPFYFLFIPSGSDKLITSDGDTFRVLDDG